MHLHRFIRLPLCSTCIHYKPPQMNSCNGVLNMDYGKCKLFPIVEHNTYEYVYSARNIESMCGKNGKYYVPRFWVSYANNPMIDI